LLGYSALQQVRRIHCLWRKIPPVPSRAPAGIESPGDDYDYRTSTFPQGYPLVNAV